MSEKDKEKDRLYSKMTGLLVYVHTKTYSCMDVCMVTQYRALAFVEYLAITNKTVILTTKIVIHTGFLQCMRISHQPRQRFRVSIEDLCRQVVILLLLYYSLL